MLKASQAKVHPSLRTFIIYTFSKQLNQSWMVENRVQSQPPRSFSMSSGEPCQGPPKLKIVHHQSSCLEPERTVFVVPNWTSSLPKSLSMSSGEPGQGPPELKIVHHQSSYLEHERTVFWIPNWKPSLPISLSMSSVEQGQGPPELKIVYHHSYLELERGYQWSRNKDRVAQIV